MSTYIVGYIQDGFHPQFATAVNDDRVLEDFCDLQITEGDGVYYFEQVDPEQTEGLDYIDYSMLRDFVDAAVRDVQRLRPTAYDYLFN